MKRFIAIIASGLIWVALLQHQSRTAAAPPATAPAGVTIRGSVHSIQLPENEPPLPAHAGRETTQLFCGNCHTSQYIVIQPPFSRDTWIAEVTKMRKVYSAPIPEEKVGEIVDYLVAVRGIDGK